MWSIRTRGRWAFGLVVLSIVIGSAGVATTVAGASASQPSNAASAAADCAFCWD